MDMDLVRPNSHLPVGGRLARFLKHWREISSNAWILDTINGYKLELHSTPRQEGNQREIRLGTDKFQALPDKVEELVQKEAVVPAQEGGEGFVSPIFLVPKPDGSWRPVINLKSLNNYVVTQHFNMESIRTVKGQIQQGDWLAKLDLKDSNSNSAFTPEVSQVSVARPNMAV